MKKLGILLVAFLLIQGALPVTAQGGAETITSIEALDEDLNGRIDTIRMTFSSDIDEKTFRLSDFVIDKQTVIGYTMPNPNQIDVLLLEGEVNTALTPTVTFTPGELRTLAAIEVEGPAPATEDKAKPILMSAISVAGSKVLAAYFSEGVNVAGGDITESDLTYSGSPGGATTIATGTLVHTAGSPRVIAELDAAAASGDFSNDVIAASTSVEDEAGNEVDPRPVDLDTPRALSAHADVGNPDVIVRFNVPVQTQGGGTISSTGAFAIAYNDPPPSPLGGIVAVKHTAGSFDVKVTLTGGVKASDVRTLDQAFMRVVSDRIFANPTGMAVPQSTLPFQDLIAPRITAGTTLDRDGNGWIDAMAVIFHEPITAICKDGLTVEDYEVDLIGTDVPAVSEDGLVAVIPLKQKVTSPRDTGLVPTVLMDRCTSGSMPFEDKAEPANELFEVRYGSITETDGAAPVVQLAATQDRDFNGFIDAYALDFSEFMTKNAVNIADWQVESRVMVQGAFTDSDTLLLEFEELGIGDTGEIPTINYTGTSVTDLSANALVSFEGGGFKKVDGAPPRILEVFGDEGSVILRVQFSEPVEQVSDISDPNSPGRGIDQFGLNYLNGNQDRGNAGITNIRHIKGDTLAYLDLTSSLTAEDFDQDRVRPAQGYIREADEQKTPGKRILVASQPYELIERDVDPPGTLGDLTVTPGVASATVSFSAPADDGLMIGSGSVDRYEVAWADATISSLNYQQFLELSPRTFEASPDLATPGQTQTLTIMDLCPSSGQNLAIVALDEDDNSGPIAVVDPFVTLADTTPPTGTMQFLQFTHRLNGTGAPLPTTKISGSLAWTGISDNEACNLQYHYVVDTNETTEPTASDAFVTSAFMNFTIPQVPLPDDFWVHVRPGSEGGMGEDTFRFPLRILPPSECGAGNITAPGLAATARSGFTTLVWDEFEGEIPNGFALKGYQVWVGQPGNYTLVDELEPPTAGFTDRIYRDDSNIRTDDRYLVTVYFSGDLCRLSFDSEGQPLGQGGGPEQAFNGTSIAFIKAPETVPTWAWVTISIIAILVVAAMVLFFVLRRTPMDESWLEEDELEVEDDSPFGPDPVTNLAEGEEPVDAPAAEMAISCPACTHNFTVQGSRPLQITCPNCQASGMLE